MRRTPPSLPSRHGAALAETSTGDSYCPVVKAPDLIQHVLYTQGAALLWMNFHGTQPGRVWGLAILMVTLALIVWGLYTMWRAKKEIHEVRCIAVHYMKLHDITLHDITSR